ncbi:hypothetical protein [Ferrimonas marina]|uniref:Uncharacterized protein n=1 Tax=Ferrimonas marina TaxID=299255 RepID=A0A1M5N4M2_9GAMM|nr:hypothetical protein [Ferrimonas marina]SHG84526.1 hypothetical protein SAMN02745129_0895 [Ferrimonas marina]
MPTPIPTPEDNISSEQVLEAAVDVTYAHLHKFGYHTDRARLRAKIYRRAQANAAWHKMARQTEEQDSDSGE